MSKKKNNSFIDIFASIAIGFMDMIKGIVRLLLKFFISFGLWLPGVYAVLGVILFYTCNLVFIYKNFKRGGMPYGYK